MNTLSQGLAKQQEELKALQPRLGFKKVSDKPFDKPCALRLPYRTPFCETHCWWP